VNNYRSENLGDGYVAHIYLTRGSPVVISLSFEGTLIAEWTGRDHVRGARAIRREMNKHKKSLKILRGE